MWSPAVESKSAVFNFFVSCTFFVSGTEPSSPSSFSEAAVAWLFPSESSETLRQMSHLRNGVREGSMGEWINEVWWRRSSQWRSETWSKYTEGVLEGNWCSLQDNYETVHKEYKALWWATFPQIYLRFFFILVCLFWPRQIALLVLAKWGKFIHEKEEWEAWLPGRSVNSSDWQSKDLALYSVLALSLCTSPPRRFTLLHYWAADNVVNGLRHE